MLGTLGHRLHSAALEFVRWGPSAGFFLLLMSVLAVVFANSPLGPAFANLWQVPLGLQIGGRGIVLSLLDWINHGLLTVFFLVVGLEIKREFTVGHLSTFRSGALPVDRRTWRDCFADHYLFAPRAGRAIVGRVGRADCNRYRLRRCAHGFASGTRAGRTARLLHRRRHH